jgi:hypothetical protein
LIATAATGLALGREVLKPLGKSFPRPRPIRSVQVSQPRGRRSRGHPRIRVVRRPEVICANQLEQLKVVHQEGVIVTVGEALRSPWRWYAVASGPNVIEGCELASEIPVIPDLPGVEHGAVLDRCSIVAARSRSA